MSDHDVSSSPSPDAAAPADPFDSLLAGRGQASEAAFSTAFRGYDRQEVDDAFAALHARVHDAEEQAATLRRERRRASTLATQSRAEVEELTKAHDAEVAEMNAKLATARGDVQTELEAARAELDDARAELTAARTQAANAEQHVRALTEELAGSDAGTGSAPDRARFDEILHVAEEQAGILIRNATVQGDRLLESARAEVDRHRAQAQADADAILAQARHDADQVRLKIETEATAHEARLERETAMAAEKVEQASREAEAIRAEAEKGAAALRSLVARETSLDRTQADEAVRELRLRTLEFEESLTRRQDDAHQEFLVLHNQAVAHAERITADANAQVEASLAHAQRVSAKADDFERLARAQAQQIEADARVRAGEVLDAARTKAQRIMDLVTSHSQAVVRDADDRARALRWQQHQLTSFMAEVRELVRPDGVGAEPADAASVPVVSDEATDGAAASDVDEQAVVDEASADGVTADDADDLGAPEEEDGASDGEAASVSADTVPFVVDPEHA